MISEVLVSLRAATGLLAVLAFGIGAAAVTGLALLAGGVAPGLAAAAALVTPAVCIGGISAAARYSGLGPAAIAATLSVAHALAPAPLAQ